MTRIAICTDVLIRNRNNADSALRELARFVLINDHQMGQLSSLDDLEQRTGHVSEEIEETIEKLKKLRKSEGGLR